MSLVIDLGNSALKWGVVDGTGVSESGRILHRGIGVRAALEQLPAALARRPVLIGVNVAGPEAAAAVDAWSDGRMRWIRPVAVAQGVRNGYRHPERLGADRWAALVGARRLAAGPWVVVGCGTALTIDLLRADGQHLGGYIVPGWHAMHDALAMATAEVKVAALRSDGGPAQDTASAVSAGCRRALLAFVTAVRDEAPADAGPWHLLLTGGDAPTLLPGLDAEARHEPHLVLLGAAALGDHAAP